MKQRLDPSLPSTNVRTVDIGGRDFSRLDYSGAGLNHVVLATEIRCHTLIFSITAKNDTAAKSAVQSLERLEIAEPIPMKSTQKSVSESQWPMCLPESQYRDYVVRKVDPEMTGPRYGAVPVRLIIGADGKIKHIHAIAGFPDQVRSMTDALAKWEFRPYLVSGRPVEVETGLLFQFPSAP